MLRIRGSTDQVSVTDDLMLHALRGHFSDFKTSQNLSRGPEGIAWLLNYYAHIYLLKFNFYLAQPLGQLTVELILATFSASSSPASRPLALAACAMCHGLRFFLLQRENSWSSSKQNESKFLSHLETSEKSVVSFQFSIAMLCSIFYAQ